jgi:hypothetical protein
MFKGLLWDGVYQVRRAFSESEFRGNTEKFFDNNHLLKQCAPMVLSNGRVVFRVFPAQDSGQVSTIVDNTLSDKLRWDSAFISLFEKHKGYWPSKQDRDATFHDGHVGDDAFGCFVQDGEINLKNMQLEIYDIFRCFVEQHEVESWDKIEFCSQTTGFDRDYPLPMLKAEKLRASFLIGNKSDGGNVIDSWRRAMSLRMNAYPIRSVFEMIDEYVNWLFRKFDTVMCADQEWEVCKRAWKTERELEQLWKGADATA